MALIKDITAREILNARGDPTIECFVILENGLVGIASVPTALSASKYEGVQLHDHEQRRYEGRGVLHAVMKLKEEIAPALIGKDVTDQRAIDMTLANLDTTENRARLGVNTLLSVSIACVKAGALTNRKHLFTYLAELSGRQSALKLPLPIFSMINGGVSGNDVIDIQEILMIPASSKSFNEAMIIAGDVHESLERMMRVNGLTILTGFRGGFGPRVSNNYEAISLLSQAIDGTNFRLGYDLFFGLDVNANAFYANQLYHVRDKLSSLTAVQLIAFYKDMIKPFHIIYIEDPLGEDDWEGWTKAYEELDQDVLLVADSLTATNPMRLQLALEKKTINAMVIKPSHVGTVMESLATLEVARAAGMKIIVASRTIETNDDFIADFAVATGADYVSFGAPARGENISKYNRLLAIQELLRRDS